MCFGWTVSKWDHRIELLILLLQFKLSHTQSKMKALSIFKSQNDQIFWILKTIFLSGMSVNVVLLLYYSFLVFRIPIFIIIQNSLSHYSFGVFITRKRSQSYRYQNITFIFSFIVTMSHCYNVFILISENKSSLCVYAACDFQL